MLDVEAIRELFPSIETSPDVLLDNAGGSQVPVFVADAMRDYMLSTYVQLGADYATSKRSTEVVDRAHDFINLFMNGSRIGKVLLASSTSVLCSMLADCVARSPMEGRNEIVVAQTAHEANAGPWFRLADRGFRLRIWKYDPQRAGLTAEGLSEVLTDKTRVVAFPHVSNMLGGVEDAANFVKMAHAVGAQVVIDGVAYAPHRPIDVEQLDADWYVYSTYKVFGPHMAAMFGKYEHFAELVGPNHFFIPNDEVPYKFELGGPSHEGCAGLQALWKYLACVDGVDPESMHDRSAMLGAYAHFAELETRLQKKLLEYLATRDDVRVIGPTSSDQSRVCTVSFVHKDKRSEEIAKQANTRGLGIRYGHFYAYRLCERLTNEGVLHGVNDGVVRVSMLHYNTEGEVVRLIDALETIL